MGKILTGIIAGLFILLLQSAVFNTFLPEHWVPNICLIFIVFLAFNEVSVAGAFLPFIIGLEFDFSTGVIVGPWAGAFTATYTILSLISKRVFLDSSVAGFVFVFVSAFIANLIYLGLLYQFGEGGGEIIHNTVNSFATALVAPVFLSLFHWLFIRRWSVFYSKGSSSV